MLSLLAGFVASAAAPPNGSLLLDPFNHGFVLIRRGHGDNSSVAAHPVAGRAVLDSLGLQLEDVYVAEDESDDPTKYPQGSVLVDASPSQRHVIADGTMHYPLIFVIPRNGTLISRFLKKWTYFLQGLSQ